MRWVIITGGPNLHYDALKKEEHAGDRIICADSGAFHAKQMGIVPEKLIGDLDSIDADTLSWIRQLHIPLEIYPIDKNMTDSELCLRSITKEHPVLLVCSLAGRPDHVLSNILLAVKLVTEGYNLTMTDGLSWIYPIAGPASFRVDHKRWKTLKVRRTLAVSLLPFTEVTGINTIGLYYPLENHTIMPGSSFSVSNRAARNAKEIGVDFSSGVLMVIVTPAV